MTLAAVLCCVMTTTVVNAQEAESPIKEGERLAKAADEAPQDWRKQFDAGCFYLNSSNDSLDLMRAEKFAARAIEIAQRQTERRDTILGKSLELMAFIGMTKNNPNQFLRYYDMAIRAYVDELGPKNAAIPPRIAMLATYKWLRFAVDGFPYGDAEAARDFREALILNQQLPEGQRAEGMEDAMTVYALSLETLMAELKLLMKDRVWVWFDKADEKAYFILAFDDWTVEQSVGFMATVHCNIRNGKKSDFKHGFVLMDEQGNITERKPTEFAWNVKCNQTGNAYNLDENSNLRVVSVSAEKRQQIIDAFHKFEKKDK